MKRSGLLFVSMALAVLLVSGVAWAALVKAADWQMNEDSGQMLDSSGNNNNGTPKNVVLGVKEDTDDPPDGQDETTYDFNGLTTPASRVEVPDADGLDPKANDITLTARVRVGEKGDGANTHVMDDDSYDVVRKGFVDTPGGDYKMEIKRTADRSVGKLHCLFRGDPGSTVKKVANLDVVDGRWHTLRCEKTGTSVVARVDGRSFRATAGSAGEIANASPVWVGAKTVTLTSRGVERGDDVFDGSMDYVSIDIAQQEGGQALP